MTISPAADSTFIVPASSSRHCRHHHHHHQTPTQQAIVTIDFVPDMLPRSDETCQTDAAAGGAPGKDSDLRQFLGKAGGAPRSQFSLASASAAAEEDSSCALTQPTTAIEDEEDDYEELRSQASSSWRALVATNPDSSAGSSSSSSTSNNQASSSSSVPQEEADGAAALLAAAAAAAADLEGHASLGPSRRRSSIIKAYDPAQISVNTKRGAWMKLKPPSSSGGLGERCRSVPVKLPSQQEQEQQQQEPSKPSSCTSVGEAPRRRVSFVAVQIREYQQTVGDNPSVSFGPPVSLDWPFMQRDALAVDLYEATRAGRRRSLRQMMLNYYHRKNLLSHVCGATEAQLVAAQKAAERVKRQRATTKALLGVSKLEEVWQAATRKTKKLGGNKKQQAERQQPQATQ